MAERLEFMLVDAFAQSPFTGNVAGVIPKADGLTDQQMQAIAAEFNAAETTFVLEPTNRDAAIRIRWFTPGCEVDFCGHATLGAVHALLESGRLARSAAEPGTVIPIETNAGILTVRTEGEHRAPPAGVIEDEAGIPKAPTPHTIWLDMPHCEPKRDPVNVPAVAHHLGLDPAAIDPALPAIRTRDDDVILAVRDLPVLLELQPAMADLGRYCRKNRIRGVAVTTTNVLTASTAAQSRFFAPAVGIDEDPVTGSLHGPLGLHLVNSGVIPLIDRRADFLCAQAKGGGRAGVVRVVVTESAAGVRSVRIGGCCVTTATGVLERLPAPS